MNIKGVDDIGLYIRNSNTPIHTANPLTEPFATKNAPATRIVTEMRFDMS